MERTIIIAIISGAATVISAVIDPDKTLRGIKKGSRMLLGILPSLLDVIILTSLFLYFVPNELIVKYLGKESGFLGILIAAGLGSIALIPGFIAYPLGAILLKNGVSYQTTSVFITTLLMVGIFTLPAEIKYFGIKISMLRNVLSFFGALVIGISMGLFL